MKAIVLHLHKLVSCLRRGIGHVKASIMLQGNVCYALLTIIVLLFYKELYLVGAYLVKFKSNLFLECSLVHKARVKRQVNRKIPKPGLVPEKSCLDGRPKNEPLCNFFEEICPTGSPSFSRTTIPDKEGPIYFHLRRLKSNHSKATRIQPKWRNEDCTTKGDKSGAGGDENSNPI